MSRTYKTDPFRVQRARNVRTTFNGEDVVDWRSISFSRWKGEKNDMRVKERAFRAAFRNHSVNDDFDDISFDLKPPVVW